MKTSRDKNLRLRRWQWALIALLVVTGIYQILPEPEYRKFLNKIEQHFNTSNEDLKLADIVPGNWTQVCYFRGDNSEPDNPIKRIEKFSKDMSLKGLESFSSIRDRYQYSLDLKNNYLVMDVFFLLYADWYQALFVFINKDTVENILIFPRLDMKINHRDSWLSSKANGDGLCVQRSNAYLKLDRINKNQPYVWFYKKEK